MPKATPATPKPYAWGTTVPAENSKAQIEQLLDAHGATEFAVYRSAKVTLVIYRLRGFMVRHKVPLPLKAELPPARRKRTKQEIESLLAGENRRRWRALLLIIKGRLEIAVGGDDNAYMAQFLSDTLLPDGQTVAESFMPKLWLSYNDGHMPDVTKLLKPGS